MGKKEEKKKNNSISSNQKKMIIYSAFIALILIIIGVAIEFSVTENDGSGITTASLVLFIIGGIMIFPSIIFLIYSGM